MKTTKYWFPVKKYGWGWGPPNCWQGWAVIGVWVAIQVCAAILLVHQIPIYIAFAAAMTVVLITICWLKGEPPRWRWGKD
jgi:hypothetical protein